MPQPCRTAHPPSTKGIVTLPDRNFGLHSTGYPTGLSRIAVTHRADQHIVAACGDNLDAPSYLLSGGVFWAPLCREALPAICGIRGLA